MIGCRAVQDRLPEYAAGRTVPDGERIAAHLARCARCAAAHRDLKAVFARLAAVPDPPVPVHGEPNARLALRTATVGERTLQRPRRRVAGASRGRMDGPRPVLAAVGMAGLVTVLGLTVVWWRERPVSERRVSGDTTVAADLSPGPSPKRGGEQTSPRTTVGFVSPGRRDPVLSNGKSDSPSPLRGGGWGERSAALGVRPQSAARRGFDLTELDSDGSAVAPRRPLLLPPDQDALERQVRRAVPVRDDFVRVPFPLLASASDLQIAAAVESYKREAAVVDARLAQLVTLQQKATALADLCEGMRADTGIQLAAGQSVADEKVTLFCEKQPLRDVMRQLSRPFGYTWLRSGKEGEYRYELVQDLRSQLLEEELRNRDRNGAMLSLEREIERYRPYLELSPDEALARAKSAPPADKPLLQNLAGTGWGPIHLYFRLAPHDLAALRSGQGLILSEEPEPSERPLPRELARGVLQSMRDWHLVKTDNGFTGTGDLTDPRGLSLTAIPEAHAQMRLQLLQSELGQFMLTGQSGFFTPRGLPNVENLTVSSTGPYAIGMSPSVTRPDNAAANAQLSGDPALRLRITMQPQPSCHAAPDPNASAPAAPEAQVTTADVLEALHRASHLPIVSDYYTRLYKPAELSVHAQPLFHALNQLADTTRLRWNKDGAWLQFRTVSYYDDRLKEVPNRLLNRWAATRRPRGMLSLDDLIEMAQLPDTQLDADHMAEGARNCFGLLEWDLARDRMLRHHLRYLDGFTPAQRQEAMSDAGLPFTRMPLAQQQGFLAFALHHLQEGLKSVDELEGSVLRVEYTQPGWFQWGDPVGGGYVAGSNYLQWVVPLEPGPQGRRVLRPRVRERTREASLQAVRRVDPKIREALWQAARRADSRAGAAPMDEAVEISPTRLRLAILYMPGATNRRFIRTYRAGGVLSFLEGQ